MARGTAKGEPPGKRLRQRGASLVCACTTLSGSNESKASRYPWAALRCAHGYSRSAFQAEGLPESSPGASPPASVWKAFSLEFGAPFKYSACMGHSHDKAYTAPCGRGRKSARKMRARRRFTGRVVGASLCRTASDDVATSAGVYSLLHCRQCLRNSNSHPRTTVGNSQQGHNT